MDTNQKLQNKINQALADWKTQANEGIQLPNFKGISTALDEYYFIMKLKVYCAYLSHGQIAQNDKSNTQKEDFTFIKTIIKEGGAIAIKNPLFGIYNQIRILYERLNEDSPSIDKLFLDAQKTIYIQAKQINREEVLDLYSFLTNFCIKKFNLGQAVYKERLFLVYNNLLNLKYYGVRGKQSPLPPQVYKNMVTYAILLQDSLLFKKLNTVGLPIDNAGGFKNGFIWAEHFVAIYKSKLAKKFRKIYPPYCAALLSFFQEDYLTAYKQLGNPSHIQGKFIHFDIKTLHLRILYEMQQISPERLEKDNIEIRKVLDAFRQLIRHEKTKKKQLKYQLDQYVMFRKCFKDLLKFHKAYYGNLYNSKNEKYLRDKVALETLIAACFGPYQAWFKAKIAEIE